jgi:hypothetical protein
MATLPRHSSYSPHQVDYPGAARFCEQQAHVPVDSGAKSAIRSLPAKDNILFTSRAQNRQKAHQFKCDFEGCTHEGTFSRNWELRRHVQTRHPRAGAGSFVCRAEGCFNKQMPWTFARSDKLTAHIKATHTCNTIFTSCPANGCNFGASTLETLGVHLERAHKNCEEGRGVLNASTCRVRKCPLWRCGKHVTAAELLDHVAGHDRNEVLAAASRLGSDGLVVTTETEPAHMEQSKRGLVIAMACPICDTVCGDFTAHLWASHLFLAKSAGLAHFVAWRNTWAEVVCKSARYSEGTIDRADINSIQPWISLKGVPGYKHGAHTIQCPSCLLSFSGPNGRRIHLSESRDAAMNAPSVHHLSLLRPEAEVVAELYPYRMQILRLYPEFVSHPVFADFDQPQDGIASSSQEPSQVGNTGFMEGGENHGQTMPDFNTPF